MTTSVQASSAAAAAVYPIALPARDRYAGLDLERHAWATGCHFKAAERVERRAWAASSPAARGRTFSAPPGSAAAVGLAGAREAGLWPTLGIRRLAQGQDAQA